MKNLDAVVNPEDVVTKAYADNLVYVGGTQPTGSEVWIDTAAPDPAATIESLSVLVASLAERVEALEAR